MHVFTPQERASLCTYLLDRLTPTTDCWTMAGCDHTLRHTTTWLARNDHDPAGAITEFHAAHLDCDCALLMDLLLTGVGPLPC